MNAIRFTFGNKKLAKYIAHMSLPSGWTCPGAKDCLTKVCPIKRRLKQFGKKFRCYSASEEAAFSSVRKMRWRNFNLLKGKTTNQMFELIQSSLPKTLVVRIHVAGDFFSQAYFDAWIKVAKRNPHILFYAYTKSLKFWVRRLGQIPPNFHLTASKGSKFDHLIEQFKLNFAEVVDSLIEAKEKNLPVDSDDSICQEGKRNFALLLHGTQAPGRLRKV